MVAFRIAQQSQTKLKHPSRKSANDEDEGNSNYRPKLQRTHCESPPAGSDGSKDTSNPADENFAYRAGCESFLVHGLWIPSGDDLFDTDTIIGYNAVEGVENNENKCQRWLRRQVSSIRIA